MHKLKSRTASKHRSHRTTLHPKMAKSLKVRYARAKASKLMDSDIVVLKAKQLDSTRGTLIP